MCLPLTPATPVQALGSNALAAAKRMRVPLMIVKPEAGRRIMTGASRKKIVPQVQTKDEPQEDMEVSIAPRPNGGLPEKPIGVKTLLAYEVSQLRHAQLCCMSKRRRGVACATTEHRRLAVPLCRRRAR